MPPDSSKKYFGRKATALLISSHLQESFPPSPPKADSPNPNGKPPDLGEWLAYLLHRTQLAREIVWYACELLSRLRGTRSHETPAGGNPPEPLPDVRDQAEKVLLSGQEELSLQRAILFAPHSPTYHHALFLASFVLSSSLHIDRSFNKKSWAAAAQDLFPTRNIPRMELALAERLEWRLRTSGEVQGGERAWDGIVGEWEGKWGEMVCRVDAEEAASRDTKGARAQPMAKVVRDPTAAQPRPAHARRRGKNACSPAPLKRRPSGHVPGIDRDCHSAAKGPEEKAEAPGAALPTLLLRGRSRRSNRH